jgi:prephenate dehydrogenase
MEHIRPAMGAWLVEEFCLDHEVAVYDLDRRKLKHFFNVIRLLELKDIEAFKPHLVISFRRKMP